MFCHPKADEVAAACQRLLDNVTIGSYVYRKVWFVGHTVYVQAGYAAHGSSSCEIRKAAAMLAQAAGYSVFYADVKTLKRVERYEAVKP